jgi:2-methylcitrate dehydratase PrpD
VTAISDLAARLTTATISDDVLEVARQRLFDSLASFAFGASSADGQLMRRVTEATGNDVGDRIRFACASTRSTEVDDIHIGSCCTAGSIVAPVAVLAGASLGVPDRRVLEALVAGYEAMIRLARAVDGALVIYQGTWTTYLTAPFGAAAATARLAGLDAEQTAHALAVAATRCVGMTGQMGGHNTSRWLMAGCAAHDGYLAGRASGLGMVGDTGILERGFGRSTGLAFAAGAFAAGWDRWQVLDVDTKPFRTGRQGLSATLAYLGLVEGRAPSDVTEVVVAVPRQVRGMLDHPKLDPNRLGLGLQYQLATLMLSREGLWAAGHASLLDDPRLHDLASRIRLVEDERLSGLYPRQWGAVVTVRFGDGSVGSAEVLDPPGSARNPYGWPELLEKHARLASAGESAEPPDWLARLYAGSRDFGGDTNASSADALLALLPGLQF